MLLKENHKLSRSQIDLVPDQKEWAIIVSRTTTLFRKLEKIKSRFKIRSVKDMAPHT